MEAALTKQVVCDVVNGALRDQTVYTTAKIFTGNTDDVQPNNEERCKEIAAFFRGMADVLDPQG